MMRFLIALVFSLGIATRSIGEDIDSAQVEMVRKNVTANLPGNWICENGPTGLLLRRVEEPIIINITSGPGPLNGQTWEQYRLASRVDIKYRIVLRLAPRVEPQQVQEMIAGNRRIQREIEAVRMKLRWGKGHPAPPETREEEANQSKYFALLQSLKPIPNGYLKGVSVYIEPTNLGFASFLSEEIKVECEMVAKKVAASLTSYRNEANSPTARQ